MTRTKEHTGELRRAFDVDRAVTEVGEWNRQVLHPATDFCISRQFTPYQVLKREDVKPSLVMLDLLWNTQFRFRNSLLRVLDKVFFLRGNDRKRADG